MERICKLCGADITEKRIQALFCSSNCRVKYHNLTKPFKIVQNGSNPLCIAHNEQNLMLTKLIHIEEMLQEIQKTTK